MRNAHLALIGALAIGAFLIGMMLDLDWLRQITKPWPVLMLAAWVWPTGDKRIAIGLVCGAVGDVCLSLPGGFLAGMVAFAVGHGLYVAAFFSWYRRPLVSLLIVTAIYLIATISLMLPNTGPLAIPVLIYMSIIGLMIWRAAALAADETTSGLVRWSPLLGALLFGFSDSLIGINKFVVDLRGSAYPIILLYWAGQGLIAAAAIARVQHAPTPSP